MLTNVQTVGYCTSVCPVKIFIKSENGVVINKCREKYCINCGDCISMCPTGAAKNTDVLTEPINNDMPSIEPSQFVDFLKKRRTIRSYKNEVLSVNEKQYLSQVSKGLNALFIKLGIPENREVLSAFSIGKKRAKYRNVKVRNEMEFETI